MERITEMKFQKLSQKEMKNFNGGRKLVMHNDCFGPADGAVSRSVYSYNWFERTFGGHSATEEEYDDATNCPN